MPTVDPKTKTLLDLMAALGEPPPSKQTIAEFRARRGQGHDVVNTPSPPVAVVRDLDVGGAAGRLKARLYDVVDGEGRPTLVYYHGGGFTYGDVDTHDGLCRRLAHYGAMRVVSVEYRLAPEHPFPAPVDDAIAAFADVAANPARYGADPARLAVGGDSAGACLATVTARDAAKRRIAGPRFQLLFYPVTLHGRETGSRRAFATGYFLTREIMDWFSAQYLGEVWGSRPDERISPLDYDPPAGLAPALVVTAGLDPLRDEGADYAAKLKAAGLDARHVDYADQIHGFVSFTAFSTVAEQAIADAARETARALG